MREKTTQGGVTAEKKKDGVPISYWSAALNMLASKKKSPRFNFFIGRTYVLVFHIDTSRQLNERTLAAVYTG